MSAAGIADVKGHDALRASTEDVNFHNPLGSTHLLEKLGRVVVEPIEVLHLGPRLGKGGALAAQHQHERAGG